MNEVNARAEPVVGGYHGQFRKVHRASWEVVCENGKPVVFRTSDAAEVAAWRALLAHLQGEIVATPVERSSLVRTKAESLFGGIFRRGRKIPVERR